MLHIFKKIEKLSNAQISALMIAFSLVLVVIGAVIWQGKALPATSDLSKDSTVIPVSTTIFPLADIVQQVGGSRVQVTQLLPSGASPHTYDLSPGDVAELSKTKLLFAIGHELDNWAIDIAEANQVPAKIVDDQIRLIEQEQDLECLPIY